LENKFRLLEQTLAGQLDAEILAADAGQRWATAQLGEFERELSDAEVHLFAVETQLEEGFANFIP
jgi:hypothetical protein